MPAVLFVSVFSFSSRSVGEFRKARQGFRTVDGGKSGFSVRRVRPPSASAFCCALHHQVKRCGDSIDGPEISPADALRRDNSRAFTRPACERCCIDVEAGRKFSRRQKKFVGHGLASACSCEDSWRVMSSAKTQNRRKIAAATAAGAAEAPKR